MLLGLSFLGGTLAAILLGMCVNLRFYKLLGGSPAINQNTLPITAEQISLERSSSLSSAETISASSRLAWSGLALIAIFILLAILAIITLMSGVVH